jgi:hypothetical protein
VSHQENGGRPHEAFRGQYARAGDGAPEICDRATGVARPSAAPPGSAGAASGAQEPGSVPARVSYRSKFRRSTAFNRLPTSVPWRKRSARWVHVFDTGASAGTEPSGAGRRLRQACRSSGGLSGENHVGRHGFSVAPIGRMGRKKGGKAKFRGTVMDPLRLSVQLCRRFNQAQNHSDVILLSPTNVLSSHYRET